MNIFKLAYKNLLHHPLPHLLTILLLTLGVGLISLLLLFQEQLETQFKKNVQGIDIVVGAKGSPLQLILANVYHIDYPTGNISLEDIKPFRKHPFVQSSIPLAYGDNYKGFRILGTDSNFIKQYKLQLNEGRFWEETMEVVIGANIARSLNLKINDLFHGTHGLIDSKQSHDHHDFKVVGILNYSGSIADHLILSSIESVWFVHDEDIDNTTDKEITALLIKVRNPMGLLQLPKLIHKKSNLQAALPAVEVNRLMGRLGLGVDVLRVLAYIILLVASVSLFIALLSNLENRKKELALLRVLGASPFKLFSLVILESWLLCLIGLVAGIIFSKVAFLWMNQWIEKSYTYRLSFEAITINDVFIAILIFALASIAALIPAIKAYRLSTYKTLQGA